VDSGIRELEATAEAEDEWLRTLAENARNVRSFQEQCTPGYYNNEGRPAEGGFIVSSYGKGPMPFFKLLAEWRQAGTYPGLELRY
jgi:cyclohexanone monooxygenase